MTGSHPPIAARRLRLLLEEPVQVPDDLGGTSRSFAPRAYLWAALTPVSSASRSTERTLADQPGQGVTHRLSLLWRGDISAQMRFRAGNRLFNILGTADPDGRRRTLVCLVEEAAP